MLLNTSTARAAVMATLLTLGGAGCSFQPRVQAGPVPPQSAGSVTYFGGGGESSVVTAGSARRVATLPAGQSFETAPHRTYVVFRNPATRIDTVVSLDAVGDYTETTGPVVITSSFRPGDNVRVIDVGRLDQVEARVIPKTVELVRVTPAEGAPTVSVSSNRALTIHRRWYEFDDALPLGELRTLELSRPILGGNAELAFTRANGTRAVVAGADGPTWETAYEQLRHHVTAIAPHVRCSSGRNYWGLVVAVLIGLGILVFIVSKVAKA